MLILKSFPVYFLRRSFKGMWNVQMFTGEWRECKMLVLPFLEKNDAKLIVSIKSLSNIRKYSLRATTWSRFRRLRNKSTCFWESRAMEATDTQTRVQLKRFGWRRINSLLWLCAWWNAKLRWASSYHLLRLVKIYFSWKTFFLSQN
jgi:hypothetical protein